METISNSCLPGITWTRSPTKIPTVNHCLKVCFFASSFLLVFIPKYQTTAAYAQECTHSSDNTAPIVVNDSNNSIKYSGPWGPKTDHNVNYHYAPYPLSGKTITQNLGATANLTFTGNAITVGSIAFFNRGYMDIFIDGKKADSFNTYGTFGPISWNSPSLSCGQHDIKIAQTDKAGGNGGRGIVLDYFRYQPCTSNIPTCAPTNIPNVSSPPVQNPTVPQDSEITDTPMPQQQDESPENTSKERFQNPNIDVKTPTSPAFSPIRTLLASFASITESGKNAFSNLGFTIQRFLTQVAP